MNRLCLAMVLCVCFAQPLCAQTKLSEDARLHKAVSLHHHLITLRDLAAELRHGTGVYLEVSRDVADEKACVFVKGKPAYELMDYLASTLLLRWEKVKPDGYRLVPDWNARRDERDFLQMRSRVVDRLWQEWIRRAYRETQAGYDAVGARLSSLSARHDLLRKLGDESEASRVSDQIEELGELTDPQVFLTARLLGQSPLLLWERLKRGEILVASTHPQPGQFPVELNPKLLNAIAKSGEEFTEPTDIARVCLTVSLREPRLRQHIDIPELDVTMMVLAADNSTLRDGGTILRPVKSQTVEQLMQEHALNRRWKKWNMAGEPLLKVELLSKPFAEPRKPYPEKGWFGQFITADYLCWFAQSTGLAVIADAYRLVEYKTPPQDARTPAEWLNAFAKEFGYHVRYEHGYLMARASDYPDRRRRDVPERLLEPLEQKVTRGEPLTLDDYAWLATQVDETVSLSDIFFIAPVPYIATRFDISLIYNIEGLAVWAYLSPAQRQLLREGRSIPFDDLAPPAQQQLVRALGSQLTQWLFQADRQEIPAEGLVLTMKQKPGVGFWTWERTERVVGFISSDGQRDESEQWPMPSIDPQQFYRTSDYRSCRSVEVELEVSLGTKSFNPFRTVLREERLPILRVPNRCPTED